MILHMLGFLVQGYYSAWELTGNPFQPMSDHVLMADHWKQRGEKKQHNGQFWVAKRQ